MDELIKAIFATYAAAGGATLRGKTTGGMWLSEAPQSAGGVYIVLTPVVAPLEYAMGTSSTKVYTQDCDMQFTFATLNGTATDVVDAMGAAKSLYDFVSMTLTGKTLLVARRLNEMGPIRDVNRGYQGIIEYRFVIGG
jgi:hypothetical protein